MKKIVTLCAGMLACTLCAGFVGCNEPDEIHEPERQGVNVPFTRYSLKEETPDEEISARWVNLDYDKVNYESKLLVINSDEELKQYVEGNYPAIDFSKKTLVLAYGIDSGVFVADGHKFQQVAEGDYEMTANLTATLTLSMNEWQAAIIVEKLPSECTIKLNTVIINYPSKD